MKFETELQKLKNIQEKIKQKNEEIVELKNKESSLTNKILLSVMNENNLDMSDIMTILSDYIAPKREVKEVLH